MSVVHNTPLEDATYPLTCDVTGKESTSGVSLTAGVSLIVSSFVLDFIDCLYGKVFFKTNITMTTIHSRILRFCAYCSTFFLAVLHSVI